MKKILFAAGITFFNINTAKAQLLVLPGEDREKNKIEDLFETKKGDLSIHFQTKLSDNISFQFEYNNVSLWQGDEEFRKPLKMAIEQLKLYADSLKPFANSRRMDIYQNERNKVISRYRQSSTNNDLRTVQNGQLEALKIGSDTLRIVKTLKVNQYRALTIPQRFQYTFVMKDLKDFSKIVEDEKWIVNTVHVLDSVMAVYQKKWRNPDAEFHSLYIQKREKDSLSSIFIGKRKPIEGFNEMSGILTLNGGFGASLVRNTLCPSVDVGMQFHFIGDEIYSPFVRVSMNSFTRFQEQADQRFKAYTTAFMNAEFGVQTNERNKYNKNFLLSMGIGYKLTTKEQLFRDPSMDKNMYKLFFNYGLSKSIILQPEMISNFRKKEEYNGWIGISIKFQLF